MVGHQHHHGLLNRPGNLHHRRPACFRLRRPALLVDVRCQTSDEVLVARLHADFDRFLDCCPDLMCD